MSSPKANLRDASPQEMYELARRIEQAGNFPDQEWTQGATSKDQNGFTVAFHSANAVTYCAIGQLHRHAADAYQGDTMVSAVEEILPLNTQIAVWNDEPTRKPEQVRQLFQEAAAKLYRKAVTAAAVPSETVQAAGQADNRKQIQADPAAAIPSR